MRDATRAGRAKRFHSSGRERHPLAAPAVDYAMYDDDPDDFGYDDDFDDEDDLLADRAGGRDSFGSLADELIDDLVPPQVDWRRIVQRHPWPALLVVGLGGYLLGRSQGKTLLRAVSALAVARVEAEVLDRIESDIDE